MTRKLFALILMLSLAAFAAQTPAPAAPSGNPAACACCQDKAPGHSCSECCNQGGPCDKAGCCKDAKACQRVRASNGPCCGKDGCCHDKKQAAHAGPCCGASCPRHSQPHAGQ